MTQIVDEFIEYFKNLPDAEKFKLGREFNEKGYSEYPVDN